MNKDQTALDVSRDIELNKVMPQQAAQDTGECVSCVNGKCVTGAQCVTLGLDTAVPADLGTATNHED